MGTRGDILHASFRFGLFLKKIFAHPSEKVVKISSWKGWGRAQLQSPCVACVRLWDSSLALLQRREESKAQVLSCIHLTGNLAVCPDRRNYLGAPGLAPRVTKTMR